MCEIKNSHNFSRFFCSFTPSRPFGEPANLKKLESPGKPEKL